MEKVLTGQFDSKVSVVEIVLTHSTIRRFDKMFSIDKLVTRQRCDDFFDVWWNGAPPTANLISLALEPEERKYEHRFLVK